MKKHNKGLNSRTRQEEMKFIKMWKRELGNIDTAYIEGDINRAEYDEKLLKIAREVTILEAKYGIK